MALRCVYAPPIEKGDFDPADHPGCDREAELKVVPTKKSLAGKVYGSLRTFYLCPECADLPFFIGCKVERLLMPGSKVHLEESWPVVQTLRARQEVARERLVRGVNAYCVDYSKWTQTQRIAAMKTCRRLMGEVQIIAAWLDAIPNSTVIVCRKCKTVNFPISGSVYRCCGVMWTYHRTNPCYPLPAGFWRDHNIGDKYKGRLPELPEGSEVHEDDFFPE